MNDFRQTAAPKRGTPPHLLAKPRKLRFADGFKWLGDALRLFRQRKWTWSAMSLTELLLIGFLQSFGSLLSLFFSGGFALAADAQKEGGELRFAYLFAGFRYKFVPLLKLTLLYLLLALVLLLGSALLFGLFGGGLDTLAALEHDAGALGTRRIWLLIIFILLLFVLFLPLSFAVWMAPALICLHDMPAWQAMKQSLKGCLHNIMPILGFIAACTLALLLPTVLLGVFISAIFGFGAGAVSESMALIALIPVFLFGIAVNAVMMLSSYTAFAAIWQDYAMPSAGRHDLP